MFYGQNPGSVSPGAWKECTRATDPDDGVPLFMAASGADDVALMTRSDFGCVQFEAISATGGVEPGVHELGPDMRFHRRPDADQKT